MQIKQRTLTVERLVAQRDSINLNPTWQRGAAWRPARQALLIDSILRGMDIPKIYLRKLTAGGAFAHDAVDGQQRIRAIWEFREGLLTLDHPDTLAPIAGHNIAGRTYGNLHRSLKDKFDQFEISIGEIDSSATSDEITGLFSRLQMGVALNPAELRNAMLTPLRHCINLLADSHPFFQDCRIPAARQKHRDYTTHAFAMAIYQGTRDIKAPDLKRMITQYAAGDTDELLRLSNLVGDALNVLATVNAALKYSITQKWIFVDLGWLIMQRHEAGAEVDPDKLAQSFAAFESRRREYNSKAHELVQGSPTRLDRYLASYIEAFRAQGGENRNLKARNAALRAFCPNIDGSR